MAYTPFNWTDRNVQNPRQYKDQNNNVLILTPDPGTVTEEGTPVTAQRMNALEQGLYTETQTPTNSITAEETVASISLPSTVFEGKLEAVLKGNTVVNLLGSDGDCESTSIWTPVNCTIALDSTNKLFESNCIKITIGTNGCNVYKTTGVIGLDASKYYITTAYIKNYNATDVTINDGVQEPSHSNSTSWTRKGFKVPIGSTTTQYNFAMNGEPGQYAFIDALMVMEVTVDEYNNLTVEQILPKYPYHNSVKSTDHIRIKSYLGDEYTQSIIPVDLKSVGSINDEFDCNAGKFIKNISDWATLSGNAYTWVFYSGGATPDYKIIGPDYTFVNSIANSEHVLRYDLTKLTHYDGGTSGANGSTLYSDNKLYLFPSNVEVGWLEAWGTGTSFTGMTWGGLIKAYMNGWRLTTANTNVASCVWTGIKSGTTKSGASGYTDVTTIIDTGFTPYKMIYQLATPEVSYYLPANLQAYPSGTIIQEGYVTDWGRYDNGIDTGYPAYPIDSLDYVNLIDPETGMLTPVDLADCTVSSDGLSFTISSASIGDYYDFGYTTSGLTTVGTLEYSYNTNLKAQVNSNTEMIANIDKKVNIVQKQVITSNDNQDALKRTTFQIAMSGWRF
jgi:hypothetical protein